jgi:hypothetical protein
MLDVSIGVQPAKPGMASLWEMHTTALQVPASQWAGLMVLRNATARHAEIGKPTVAMVKWVGQGLRSMAQH